eukprot:5976692-Prymnesium_polylepis.1
MAVRGVPPYRRHGLGGCPPYTLGVTWSPPPLELCPPWVRGSPVPGGRVRSALLSTFRGGVSTVVHGCLLLRSIAFLLIWDVCVCHAPNLKRDTNARTWSANRFLCVTTAWWVPETLGGSARQPPSGRPGT